MIFVKYYTMFFIMRADLVYMLLLILQPRVVERHFLDLGKRYGSVVAVDLVNKVFFLEEGLFLIVLLVHCL